MSAGDIGHAEPPRADAVPPPKRPPRASRRAIGIAIAAFLVFGVDLVVVTMGVTGVRIGGPASTAAWKTAMTRSKLTSMASCVRGGEFQGLAALPATGHARCEAFRAALFEHLSMGGVAPDGDADGNGDLEIWDDWGLPVELRLTGDRGDAWEMRSAGPDGAFGTADDIAVPLTSGAPR